MSPLPGRPAGAPPRSWRLAVATAVLSLVAVSPRAWQDPAAAAPAASDVIVTATVTDAEGHLVLGLGPGDFTILEDGVRQDIAHFNGDPAPVSLGVLMDVSSALFERREMGRVQSVLLRFALERLAAGGDLFLAEYSVEGTRLVQTWTMDRALAGLAFGSLTRRSGTVETALYDAMAVSLPLVSAGQYRRRVQLILSGKTSNDASAFPPTVLQRVLRETDVLVYALTSDGTGPRAGTCPVERICQTPSVSPLDRIAADTGGRTEVVVDAGDLVAATVRLERELSAQYFIGYRRSASPDGRHHALRVETRDPSRVVRVRRHVVAR